MSYKYEGPWGVSGAEINPVVTRLPIAWKGTNLGFYWLNCKAVCTGSDDFDSAY